MAPLCVQLYEQIPAILFPLNTCVFNSSFRSSVSTWQVRLIRNQWTMAAIMSSQHRREHLLWSTSWRDGSILPFPDVSPDMNPCDSFLWGHLKSKTYSPMPNSMPALKNKLRRKFREIPAWMVQHAILNIKKRARLCIEADGGHFEPWM